MPAPYRAPLQVILARTLTLDPAQPEVGAVLVGGGRVLATGSREELLALAPRAEVLDHRAELLTPGLCDGHIHLVTYGASLSQLDVSGTRSVSELQARLLQRVAQTPPGEWVLGVGFLLSELGLAGYPSAALLDEVSPHHPVALRSRDHHMLWANSRALAAVGIGEGTPDPEGGKILRPLGCLLENAQELLLSRMPQPSQAEREAAAKAGADDLLARGFVSAHTMAYEDPAAPRALQALAGRGELAVRVWACLPHERLALARDLGVGGGGGGLFQWGGVKFFADGALGSRTAWLHEPGFADGSGTGIALDSPQTIRELGEAALELGLVPVTHAIGDRANTEVLDAYDDLREAAARRGLHLRVEHAQHLRPQDLPRLRGLVVSVQPIHLLADGPITRELLPHRADGTYAFRSIQEAGGLLVFGSDAPVALPDLRASFAAAQTRVDDAGQKLAPGEAMSELDILEAYTRTPALAAGWTDEGVIRPGARAAFTVWSRLGGEARGLVL